MRYYKIVVSGKTFESYTGGKNVPGALDVELDIPVFPFAVPAGAAFVKIWGVSINDIKQASDLNNKDIAIYGGFQKGLPLAKPGQSGLLAKGFVFQAFGNWEDTRQSLDLIVFPKTGTNDDPKNFVINWKKGQKLKDAVTATLAAALPDYSPKIEISDDLVLPADEIHVCSTLVQFAAYVKGVSKDIKGGKYPGVDLAISDDKINGYDGTKKTGPKELAFEDLVGQPTWIDPLTVQAKLAMRADLVVGDYLKFPKAIVRTSAGSTSPFVDAKATFQGEFQIGQARHVGHFRQPDADSWVTVVNAYSSEAAK